MTELDLHVEQGEIVSVIGPNGAGKTTLFNLITGIYEPDAGKITLGDQSIVGLQPHQITRLGIARTFQTLRLFLNMSVRENVMAAAYGTHEGGRLPLDAADAGHAARGGARSASSAEEAPVVLRRAPQGLPLGSARLQPLLREPPAARDRARDGDRGEDPAARRARRRA